LEADGMHSKFCARRKNEPWSGGKRMARTTACPNASRTANRRKYNRVKQSSEVDKFKRAQRINAAHDAAMNFTKNIGMLLLAVYLIVVGIIGLTGIGPGVLLPILALIAGVFILLGK